MGIEAKLAYRDFLKSDLWKSFRLEAMCELGPQCAICGKYDIGNDVHHINYPSQWRDTTVDDVVVLCRKHHKSVHRVMDSFPSVPIEEIFLVLQHNYTWLIRIMWRMRSNLKSGRICLGFELRSERARFFKAVDKIKPLLQVHDSCRT